MAVGIKQGVTALTKAFLGTTAIARIYKGTTLVYQLGAVPVIGSPTVVADGYIVNSGTFGGVTTNVNIDVGAAADPDRLFVICVTWNKTSTSTADGGGAINTFAGLVPQGILSGYVGSDNNFNTYIGAINIGLLTGVQVLNLFSAQYSDCYYRIYRFDAAAVKNMRYQELLASALGVADQMTLATNDMVFGLSSGEDVGAGVKLVAETDTIRKDYGYSYYHPPLQTSRSQDFEIGPVASAGVKTLTRGTNAATRFRNLGAFQINHVPPAPVKAAITDVPVFCGSAPDSVNRTYKVNVGDEDPGRWFVLFTSKARSGVSGSMTTWSATLDGQPFTVKTLVVDNRGQFQAGAVRLPTGTGIKDLVLTNGTGGDTDLRVIKVSNADLLSHQASMYSNSALNTAALTLSATCSADDLLLAFGMIRDSTISNIFDPDPQILTPGWVRTMNGAAFKAQCMSKISAGGSESITVEATGAALSKMLHLLRFRTYTPFTSKVLSSNVQGGSAASLVVPWPAGTVAGDKVIIFVEGGYDHTSIAGWTNHSHLTGSFVSGGIYSKVMDAADITAGSVTIAFGGTYGMSAAAVRVAGTTTINLLTAGRDVATGSTQTLVAALADDEALFYAGVRDGAAGTGTVDQGATIAQGDYATNQAHSRVVTGRVYEAGNVVGTITHAGRAYFAGLVLR